MRIAANVMIASLALLLPITVVAQTRAAAPVIIIGEGAPSVAPPGSASVPSVAATPAPNPVPGAKFPNFPEAAITRIGETTTGVHVDAPANPPSPSASATAASSQAALTPASPAAPPSPVSPISKLWPRNTVEIFLPPCTRLRPQFLVPCTCVITKLMLAMPHDEFLAKSEAGTIEADPRLIRIRTDCATAPQKKE